MSTINRIEELKTSIKELKAALEDKKRQKIISEYNLLLDTLNIIKQHTEKEVNTIQITESLTVDKLDVLKSRLLICDYILKHYDKISNCDNICSSQELAINEVKYLYNNGNFINENTFNIFRYNKWLQSDKGQELVNKINCYKVVLYILCLLGPIFLPAFIPSGTSSLENVVGSFAISAFASPILLPVECFIAYLLTKTLDDKYYTTIEQRFNIKIDHSSEKSDIAAVGLAMKTHYSLSNEWKKGDWIEK